MAIRATDSCNWQLAIWFDAEMSSKAIHIRKRMFDWGNSSHTHFRTLAICLCLTNGEEEECWGRVLCVACFDFPFFGQFPQRTSYSLKLIAAYTNSRWKYLVWNEMKWNCYFNKVVRILYAGVFMSFPAAFSWVFHGLMKSMIADNLFVASRHVSIAVFYLPFVHLLHLKLLQHLGLPYWLLFQFTKFI